MPSNLPALEKTWQFSTNNPVIGITNSGTSHARLVRKIWQILEDEIDGTHFFATGTMLDVGTDGGYNPGTTALAPSLVGNLVGKKAKVRGATSAANNGDFVITTHDDVGGGIYRILWANATAVAETLTAGSIKVTGRVGFSFPWEVWYTDRAGVSAALAGDGVDRMTTIALSDWNISGITTIFHKILRNPVTGTNWTFRGYTNSAGSQRGVYMVWFTVMGGYSGGANTLALRANQQAQTNPTAATGARPDGQSAGTGLFQNQSSAFNHLAGWFNGDANDASVLFNSLVHCMMSSDGKHTRLIAGYNGGFQLFAFDEEVKNPIGMGAYPYISGKVTAQSTSTGCGAEYVRLTDAANAGVGTLDVDRFTVNYDYATAYWTGEGYATGHNGRNVLIRNAITGNQPMYRVGLHSSTTNLLAQSRFGELKDMYWTHDAVPPGTTFPDDSTRQWLCIGAVMVPWDGSVPEFSF